MKYKSNSEKKLNVIFTKKKLVLILIIIATTSLLFKLYTVDFSLPVNADNLGYTLDAIQYSQGDFFIPAKKNPGWPLFISPFMLLFDSDDFIDYSNLVRVLSLSIATFTIWPAYLLGRKFFNEKYSIMVAILFAFEPHLNYNAGEGLSEPLYILILLTATNFILSKKNILLGFVLSGFAWWIRFEGILFIIPLVIVYLLYNKRNLRTLVISIALYFLVVTPIFAMRYAQFDDPFYIWFNEKIFASNYSEMVLADSSTQIIGYDLISRGIQNISNQLLSVLYPYLIFLIPIGIIFTRKSGLSPMWIIIILMLAFLVIPFANIIDKRFLYHLIPFLTIIATHGILNLCKKKERIILTAIIGCVTILTLLFTIGIDQYGFGSPDINLEKEKMSYATFIVANLKGKILDGASSEYFKYAQINDNNFFKNYKSPRGKDPFLEKYQDAKITEVRVFSSNINELIINGEKQGLKYITVTKDNYHYPFLSDIYDNEENYPYLIKVYEVDKLYKAKLFEINYKKFHSRN